jgi:hypothetical protein
MRLRLLFALLFVGTLAGCEEDTEIEPTPPNDTFPFTFQYDPARENIQEYELIVTQQDGKILLDTLVSVKTAHALKVKTQDDKVNLTTIYKDPVYYNHILKTYLQVNPDKWNVVDFVEHPASTDATESATVIYENIPYVSNAKFDFKSHENRSYSMHYFSAYDQLKVSFNRVMPNDMAYLLHVTAGKYIFTPISDQLTHVDFSQAGSTLTHTFNKPEGITSFSTLLYGILKAGDYAKSMKLYESRLYPSENYDLQYPTTHIEEFDLALNYTDAKGFKHSYNHIAKTIPTQMQLEAGADFEVASSSFDNFRLTFGSEKPTSLTSFWISRTEEGNMFWHVHASPDASTFNPRALLEKLNSRYINNTYLDGFQIWTIQSNKAKDLTYQTYRDYMANPEAILKKELKQSRTIVKNMF